MSDESTSVVCLGAEDAGPVASRAIAFLLAERVIEPNARQDDLMQPSEWAPGPAAESVLAQPVGLPGWRDLANNGVDVDQERALRYAMQSYEVPDCPSCATALAEDRYFSLLDDWVSSQEPGANDYLSSVRSGCVAGRLAERVAECGRVPRNRVQQLASLVLDLPGSSSNGVARSDGGRARPLLKRTQFELVAARRLLGRHPFPKGVREQPPFLRAQSVKRAGGAA